jgi:hypothetical protein
VSGAATAWCAWIAKDAPIGRLLDVEIQNFRIPQAEISKRSHLLASGWRRRAADGFRNSKARNSTRARNYKCKSDLRRIIVLQFCQLFNAESDISFAQFWLKINVRMSKYTLEKLLLMPKRLNGVS